MLIRRIERFLRETGMPWTKFGRLAVNDPNFVERLRNGTTSRPSTVERVDRFIESYTK